MSRKVIGQFIAPLIVPLRRDLLDIALYFAAGLQDSTGIPPAQYRANVLERLDITDDELDAMTCWLPEDSLEVKLFDDTLIVAPNEGVWGDLSMRDMRSLVGFIQRFGDNHPFPILLHSVVTSSDTNRIIAEEILSEFVTLSETETKVFRQASAAALGLPAQGFLTTLLNAGNLLDLTPTTEQKFT